MAARCGPRAMKATSSPAWASLAPKYPPIPPAPKTAMRIVTSSERERADHTFSLQPNARGEPRPMAEATQERKLLGVGSTAKLDAVSVTGAAESLPARSGDRWLT